MEDLSLFDQYPILQIISYIITVIIGGVGFKYLQLWLGHKENTRTSESDANQQLIINLQNRVDNLTNTIDRMEQERSEIHSRELERVQKLTRAELTIELLEERLRHLTSKVESLSKILKKYEKKYGRLDE